MANLLMNIYHHTNTRLYSERQILARGLAHPIVFMGRTTPRALDGVVDGVVKQSEEQSSTDGNGNSTGSGDTKGASKEATAAPTASGKAVGGDGENEGKDGNSMQTFFTKVGRA